MVALFLALTAALVLVLWAELDAAAPRHGADVAPRSARAKAPSFVPPAPPKPANVTPAEDVFLARLARLMEEPSPTPSSSLAEAAPQPPAQAQAPDLPVISGYRPGDVIELELEGPAPRPEDIAFEQSGRDTCVLIEGFPALMVARAPARSLSAANFRFRSPHAA